MKLTYNEFVDLFTNKNRWGVFVYVGQFMYKARVWVVAIAQWWSVRLLESSAFYPRPLIDSPVALLGQERQPQPTGK